MRSIRAQPETEILHRLTVRLLRQEERAAFDQCLQQQHPLRSSLLVGQALRYVAELDGGWVALLSFSAPTRHLKGSERWNGWSQRQRARRLGS